MGGGLDPEEKGWAARHQVATTFIVIAIIAAVFTVLKILQPIYFPAEEKEFKTPVFLNETFIEVDAFFNTDSNLTEDEQNTLFDEKYKYNVVKWTCRPISCQELLNQPTLKLVCKEYGITEDVRIAMKEDCTEQAKQAELTVVFQLMSKTTGEYYLGRSGRVVTE
jgi:hypothetical protein